jgi:hypothetical protein
MPYNLLLLPLLGGYIFARKCHPTRYNALRSESYKLLFVAAEFGVYFLLVAALLRFIFNLIVAAWPPLFAVDQFWHQVVPFEYSGVAFLAFFLGLTLWAPANRYRYDREIELDKVIRAKGDPLEVLLRDAMLSSKPIIVTLQSGKVYVGQVICNFNPAYDVQSVKISTIMSGYRKSDDQTVIFNTNYGTVLKAARARDIKDPEVTKQDVKDLGTVIPISEIQSAGIFSLPMYTRFFAHLANQQDTRDHP